MNRMEALKRWGGSDEQKGKTKTISNGRNDVEGTEGKS
jgi:hypothetical protein